MAKRIVWTDQAKADVRAIEQKTALQILKTLARFAKTEEGNIRQLVGVEPAQFRLRTQDHRVFFHVREDVIEIIRVRDRKEAYR
jgi:mRNA-degrading endonuclease RelE of RelBE toxin-antitoxin system